MTQHQPPKREREGLKRISIDVPPALHRRLKTFCVSKDLQITTYVVDRLTEALDVDCPED